MADRRVVVAAAVVERDGLFLVTRRLGGTHLEGCWEFPGGKCEADESPVAGVTREIQEELGCAVDVGDELLATAHDYPDRRVELHFFRCRLHSEPRPLLGQEMRWVSREELRQLELPPADAALIRLLLDPGPLV